MPASQEQKVDFLLKKIGYSASKTGIAEDESAIGINTNTAKAPFEEGIPSPLIIPSTNILSDSSFIPTTPPGSDTAYVKVYSTTSALRMTRDSTVGTATRTYIAYTTYNDTSSARLTNWIDTQFGSSYILKVFKDDPTVPANELQQAGAGGGTDGWFFDYSSGVLNFNGNALPSGISATNIYIVGYRYIGATGVQPPAGIGTFHDLVVSNNLSIGGISTFTGNIDANGNLDVDGQTELDELNVSGVSTFASAIDANGNVDVDGNLKITTGKLEINTSFPTISLVDIENDSDYDIRNANGTFKITDQTNLQQRFEINSSGNATFANNLNVTGNLDVDGRSELDNVNIAETLNVSGVSTFAGTIDANGIIEATAGQNKIPSLYQNFSDLPNAGTYHGMFAHVHALGRGYFAHGGAWYELVNKESNGVVGTGTEKYNLGFTDTVNLKVTGITTLGSIGISTGIISGPSVTYIDPAAVGDNTGTVVIKGDLQIDGTQTTVNSSTMTVTDKNIEMAVGAANDAAADGGGITVKSGDGDKTWRWLNGTDSWTSSEHIRIPDGKVFGFASDTNTYIGRPAADTIAFTHGGSEKVRINSDGNVGIGTNDPDQKLHVYNGAGDVTSFVEAIAGDAILDLSNTGNANYSGINFTRERSDNTGVVGGSIFMPSNTANNEAFLYIQAQSANAGAGVTSALSVNNGVRLKLHGDDGIFSVETGSKERLRVGAGGSVGIGTDNPGALLHLKGTGGNKSGIRLENGAGESLNMFFAGSNSNSQFSLNYGGTGQNDIIFTHDGNIITNQLHGGLGIGTYNPSGKLEVLGASNLKGNLNVTGISTFHDNVQLGDSSVLGLGAGGFNSGVPDLRLYHNGSSSNIINNVGHLYISQIATGKNLYLKAPVIQIQDSNGNDIITTATNGGITVKHNNSTVLETSASGISITGNTDTDSFLVSGISTFTGAIDANGDLDVDGHTNLDNVSIAETLNVVGFTTTADIKVSAGSSITIPEDNDNTALFLGDFTTPSASGSDGARLKQNTTGNTSFEFNNLFNTGKQIQFNAPSAGGTLFVVSDNPSVGVGLYCGGNNEKLRTVGTGITVYGTTQTQQLNVSGISTFTGAIDANNNLSVSGFSTFSSLVRANSGLIVTGNIDLTNELNFTGNANKFVDFQTLDNNKRFDFRHINASSSETAISCIANGAVKLYHNGQQKFTTTGTGIEIPDLNVSGVSTFSNTTFTGTVSAGGTTGTDGYYLKSTGIGVTWAQFPTMRTNQVFTATADQTTFSFSYNVGLIDVFVNGVKLPTSEFTASNGSSVILDDGCFVNDTVELISYNTVPTSDPGAQALNQLDDVTITGSPVIGETLQHNGSAFVNDYTPSATTTSTSQTAILSLATATYRSVEYTVQITEGTKYHVTKILAVHDGTNVSFNEYGTLFTTSSLATFALDVNSGNMRLLATPASSASTVFKIKFNGIKV